MSKGFLCSIFLNPLKVSHPLAAFLLSLPMQYLASYLEKMMLSIKKKGVRKDGKPERTLYIQKYSS